MTPTDKPGRPRAFTVDAAAVEAGVSKRTMWRLIQAELVKTVHSGNRRLVTEESLRAYIAQRRQYEVVDAAGTKAAAPAEPVEEATEEVESCPDGDSMCATNSD